MAFHPFKHFRKHQKVYLAGLTIMTMIIFVASFGAGDLFTSLQRWLAISAYRGDKVLSLYGKTVRSDELEKLRWQRQLASEFVLYNAFGVNIENPLGKSLADIQKRYIQKKGGNDLPTPVQQAYEQMTQAFSLAGSFPADMRLQPAKNALADIQTKLSKMDAQSNPEQYRALDALATNIALWSWANDPQRRLNDSYFGGTLSRPEDLLDFLVWKQQADRLGIVLTPGDVCRQVNRAWGHGDYLPSDGKIDSNEFVVAFFNSNAKIHKNLAARDLLSALTDEFRVQMVKQALLGSTSGVRGYREAVDGIHISPVAATPDEFFKYFQEQRTTLSVGMLPLSVESFVAEAKQKTKPTEADLRNLYARYKDVEPSPIRREPGFKEPRRIKIEYFSFQPEGPFAQKLAAKASELLPIFRIGQPAAPFAAGGGVAWAASMAGYADMDTAILSLYEKYREDESRRVTVKYDRGDDARFGLAIDLFNRRAVDAQAAAAMVGELLGGLDSGGTTLAAPIAWLAVNDMAQRAALTAYASTVLAGPSPSPITTAILPMRYLHTPQPLEAVREQMIDRFRNELAKKIMDDRIQELRKELDKVLAGHSEEKLAELMKKATAEYGIENIHIMKDSQTRQEVLDNPDPALKPLQQAYYESTENLFPMMEPTRPDFVSALFHSFEPSPREREIDQWLKREPRPWRTRQFKTFSGDRTWVFWRAEDKQAHVRPFETIRAEVEQTWYFEQARKLTRDKAQQINKELKTQNLASPEAARQFLIQQNLGTVFELKKVSHLTTPDFSLPGREKFHDKYRPYVPPKEFVPYPPADFVDQLLKLKKRLDSLVMADKPVKNFYIAVLMENPQLPERSEFYDAYNLPSLENFGLFSNVDQPLWYQMMADRQRKYERKMLEQLRVEATPDLEAGDYVLPDSVRNRGESSRDFGE